MEPERVTSPGETVCVWEMDEEAFAFLMEIVPGNDGFSRDLHAVRERLERENRLHDEEIQYAPCPCSPGDQCSCSYDCDCRERMAHLYTTAEGWKNIEDIADHD